MKIDTVFAHFFIPREVVREGGKDVYTIYLYKNYGIYYTHNILDSTYYINNAKLEIKSLQ